MFKVNNRNTRTRCEIRLKLAIKTPERRYWRLSGVFIVNFEYISHFFLVVQKNAAWGISFRVLPLKVDGMTGDCFANDQ